VISVDGTLPMARVELVFLMIFDKERGIDDAFRARCLLQ
jgi:hypothetical protein